jgi:RimJ/RimL family protein N-acetyltransferase
MFKTVMSDGTALEVRTVQPSDRPWLLAGFKHLSQRSRYFRFLRAIDELSDENLEQFTSAPDARHMALGALDVSSPTTRPVGISRYERFDGDGAQAAEMAVTVVDAYQGRGIGALLIGATAWCAAHAGITELVAYVHPENKGMIRLLRSLGAPPPEHGLSDLVFRLPISRDAEHFSRTGSGMQARRAYDLMRSTDAAGQRGPTG